MGMAKPSRLLKGTPVGLELGAEIRPAQREGLPAGQAVQGEKCGKLNMPTVLACGVKTTDGKEQYLLTAGGKIQCVRCIARSSRTGVQCGRPALKSSKTQKCQFHGGRSTGPKTAEGKARVAAAHTVHGQETNTARGEHSAGSARLSRIEDAMYLLEMTSGPRIRGRKARGYVPVNTLDGVRNMVLGSVLNPN